MLFSQPELAQLMNQKYECVWESLRPAPKVDIDFGNGYRLERTLNGNIATFLLTADGGTYDIVPGLVDPNEYRSRLEHGLAHHASLSQAPHARAFVEEYHTQGAGIADEGLFPPPFFIDVRKAAVEYDLKARVGMLHRARRFPSVLDAPLTGDAALLAEDTAFNREHRYPAVHRMLAAAPLASPRELTGPLFHELLHVDLDDPFLGLAPDVVGGRLGRHGPQGPLDAPHR